MKNKIMKDPNVKAYARSDKKARTLWAKVQQIDNPKKQAKLEQKAKSAYAERDAYALILQRSLTKGIKTDFKVENSFNGNFTKTKTQKQVKKALFH